MAQGRVPSPNTKWPLCLETSESHEIPTNLELRIFTKSEKNIKLFNFFLSLLR